MEALFKVSVITIFPEIFPGPLSYSLAGSALNKGIWSCETINLRDFGRTKHKNVDDEPYGGGSGLIIRPDVAGEAIEYALKNNPGASIYYPSPRGRLFNQVFAKEIAAKKNIIIICGRFEGLDERVIEEYRIKEVSVGDYILSGGEVAALSILDSAIRLLSGVVVNTDSLASDSFEEYGSLLEYPLYTRPASWKNRKVPEVLLSGNHREIDRWKLKKSIEITKERRPDLI